ncbi:MAG: helix-turn-helix domain-containing protein [Syntrophales bacterium]
MSPARADPGGHDEGQHYHIPLPDPIEAILYHMESRDLARCDLEPFIGSRARVSEVLSHKRPLTMAMIRNLSKGLGIWKC